MNAQSIIIASMEPVFVYSLILNSGHKAYVGFLYLEHTYNNAVVNMFVKLMMNVVWARQRVNVHYGNGDTSTVPLLNEDAELNSIQANVENDFCGPLLQGDAGKRRSYQARNRWLVAYTLLRNPSLQELTASRIEEKKPQEVVATGETDPGLEAESSDIKQPLWSTVKEANFEVTS